MIHETVLGSRDQCVQMDRLVFMIHGRDAADPCGLCTG
jgi:hypothetical protein